MKYIIKFFNDYIRDHLIFVCILLCLVVIVLSNLPNSSLADEEAWVILISIKNNIYEMIWGDNFHSRITPVAHLFLFKLIHNIYGDIDYLYRVPSAVFFFATMFVGYKFSTQISKNKNAGILFILLWAINSKVISFAYLAKQYSADMFFSITILYLYYNLYKLNNKENTNYSIALFFTCCLAIIFSYPSIFIIITVIILWLINIISNKKTTKQWFCFTFFILGFFVNVYFTIVAHGKKQFSWATEAFEKKNGFISTESIYDFLTDTVLNFKNFVLFFDTSILLLFLHVPAFITFILWISSMYILIKNKKNVLLGLLFLPFLMAIIASCLFIYPFFGYRTDMYLTPIYYVGISYSCIYLLKKITHLKFEKILISSVLIIQLISIIVHYSKITKNERYYNTQSDMFEYIEKNKTSNNIMLYCPNTRHSVSYYSDIYDLQDVQKNKILDYGSSRKENLNFVLNFIDLNKNHKIWLLCSRNNLIPLRNNKCDISTIDVNYTGKKIYLQEITCN